MVFDGLKQLAEGSPTSSAITTSRQNNRGKLCFVVSFQSFRLLICCFFTEAKSEVDTGLDGVTEITPLIHKVSIVIDLAA